MFNNQQTQRRRQQQLYNFEKQLETKLSNLNNQQSSSKKNKITKMQNQQNQHRLNNYHIDTQIQAITRNNQTQQNQVQNHFQIINDQKIVKILKKYFKNQVNVGLYQFIQALCIQYALEIRSSHSDFDKLVQSSKKQLTTVNQNQLSLGALEILLKKYDLKNYLVQKILHIKYKRKKKELEENYKIILKQIENRQQNISQLQCDQDQREYAIKKKENQLDIREKSIKQKDKQLSKRQKDLLQRDKAMKLQLQQKSQKLFHTYIQQIQKSSNTIINKSIVFQKNAKMKINTIQRRIQQLNRLKNTQYNKFNQDNNQKNNQILALNNKIRKLEKQIQKSKKSHLEQINKIQQQNKQFLKASSILQSKVEKLNKKLVLNKQLLEEKDKKISILQHQINQKQLLIDQKLIHQKNKNSQQINEGINISRSVSNSNLKKIKNSRYYQNNQPFQSIINIFNKIIQKIFSKQQIKEQIYALLSEDISTFYKLSNQVIKFMVDQNINFTILIQILVITACTSVSLKKYRLLDMILLQNKNKDEVQQLFVQLQSNKYKIIKPINLTKNNHRFQAIFQLYSSFLNQNSINILQNLIRCKYFSQLILQNDKIVTYILQKYFKNSKSQQYFKIGQLLIDIFLEVSNNQSFIKSLFNLQNYRYLIIYLTKINLYNQYLQILQKGTILIQRLVYAYGNEIILEKSEIKWMKKILRQKQKQSQLLQANLKSILAGTQNTFNENQIISA